MEQSCRERLHKQKNTKHKVQCKSDTTSALILYCTKALDETSAMGLEHASVEIWPPVNLLSTPHMTRECIQGSGLMLLTGRGEGTATEGLVQRLS
jgi:hypothetical protein